MRDYELLTDCSGDLAPARGLMLGATLAALFFWMPAALFLMWRFHR